MRRSSAFVLPWLLVLLAGSASQVAAQPLIVSGQVLDGEGGPVASATVALFPMREDYGQGLFEPEPVASAISGESGWFEVDAPDIGYWRVRVESEGYSPMETALEPLLQSTSLKAVTLPRTEPVDVHVVDPSGRPVAEADVRSWTVSPVWGSLNRPSRISDWQPASRVVKTDAGGRATVHLAAGDQVQAGRSGKFAAFGAPSRKEDGSLEKNLMLVLRPRLQAGGEAVVSGAIGSPTPYTIDVVDTQGRPVPDALIWGWPARRFARTGPDGRCVGTFEGVSPPSRFPPGHFSSGQLSPRLYVPRLYVAKHGYVGTSTSWQDLDGDSGVAARVPLEPAGVIRGRLLGAMGDPVSGVEIELDPLRTGGQRMLPARVVSGRGGTFQFDGLPPGEAFVLELSPSWAPPVRRYVETGADIELRLEAGATMLGRLVDEEGNGIGAGRIELFQDPEAEELPIRITGDGHSIEPATSDSEGRFSLAPIPRGLHGALITAPGRAPKVLMDVEIEEGEVRDLGELALRAATPLRVRFVDSERQPVAGVEVRLSRSGDPPFATAAGRDLAYLLQRQLPSEFESDGQGRVVIEGFTEETRVQLSFSHPEFIKGRRDFAVVEEEAEYVLERGQLLEGRVVDTSGRGIESVRVTAETQSLGPRGSSSYYVHAFSESDGLFVLKAVPAGRVLVTARARGFVPLRQELRVEPGEWQDGSSLELVMSRGLTLRGRVTGVASEDLRLTPVRIVYEPKPGWPLDQSTVPDAEGDFELSGLLPGPAEVSATHANYGTTTTQLVIDEAMAPIVLDLGNRIRVSGRVTDVRGGPVAHADVFLEGGLASLSTKSGRDGTFSFLLDEPGAYALVATKQNWLFARRAVEIFDTRSDLDLELQRGASLTGTIGGVDPDSWPKVSVRAQRLDCGESAQVPRSEWSHQASVDLDGRFRFSGLAPGRWKIWATRDGSALYAESFADIGPGEPEIVADLHFDGAGRVLEGRVLRNGAPAAGLTIYSAGVMTDEQGYFTIEGVDRPFTLHVPGPWGSVLHKVDPRSESFVTIAIKTHRVGGTIVDASGIPVPETKVSVFDLGPRQAPGWRLTSDGLGRFDVPEVLEGHYRFEIDSESGSLSRPVTIDRDLDDLRLVLEPRVPVSSTRP